MRNLTNVIFVVLLLIALAIVVFVSTLIFVGIGYGLSCILPLSLFQGALLSISAAFVLVVSILSVALVKLTTRQTELEYIDDEYDEDLDGEFDDDDQDDDQDDDIEDLHNRHRVVENTVKIGRNRLCPCGSGLKYKRCCGKDG